MMAPATMVGCLTSGDGVTVAVVVVVVVAMGTDRLAFAELAGQEGYASL